MPKPLIGLTTYGRREHDLTTVHYDELFYLPGCYVDAVRRAGGIPVLLPPGEQALPEVLDRLDGIVFTGGCDIDPIHYQGDRQHEALGPLDDERDAAELEGIRLAINHASLPTLCVCRGFQILNVAMGGTLVEHVPDLGNGDMHRSDDGLWTLHDVDVRPDTRLAQAMRAETVHTTSGHHQAAREVGDGLTVSATAADGVAEGLELNGHPWMVAVQWHPEITAHQDPTQQNLFNALVEKAAGR